jgi:hypothetical protein
MGAPPKKTKVNIGTMRRAVLLLLTTAMPPPASVVVRAAPRSSSGGGVAPPPPSSPSSSGPTTSGAPLRFASPLQCYTIFDRSFSSSPDLVPPRRRFLPRFRAGLVAERAAREALAEEQRRGIVAHPYDDDDDGDDGGIEGSGGESGWAEASAGADERRRKVAEARVEAAHDAAVRVYDERVAAAASSPGRGVAAPAAPGDGGGFQFVGVVNDGRAAPRGNDGGASSSPVTWYARRRPRGSKWNVRLVHVNRDAVLRDLFVRGRVDVFGRYVNEGTASSSGATSSAAADDAGDDAAAARPRVTARYAVRERSWRTLWNFSPRRALASSSGSFWRERRVTPGLYTDGSTVYESVYRYRDGKNGMKPVAKLGSFLSSTGIGQEEKMRIVERLKGGDEPDLVVEK